MVEDYTDEGPHHNQFDHNSRISNLMFHDELMSNHVHSVLNQSTLTITNKLKERQIQIKNIIENVNG